MAKVSKLPLHDIKAQTARPTNFCPPHIVCQPTRISAKHLFEDSSLCAIQMKSHAMSISESLSTSLAPRTSSSSVLRSTKHCLCGTSDVLGWIHLGYYQILTQTTKRGGIDWELSTDIDSDSRVCFPSRLFDSETMTNLSRNYIRSGYLRAH